MTGHRQSGEPRDIITRNGTRSRESTISFFKKMQTPPPPQSISIAIKNRPEKEVVYFLIRTTKRGFDRTVKKKGKIRESQS